MVRSEGTESGPDKEKRAASIGMPGLRLAYHVAHHPDAITWTDGECDGAAPSSRDGHLLRRPHPRRRSLDRERRSGMEQDRFPSPRPSPRDRHRTTGPGRPGRTAARGHHRTADLPHHHRQDMGRTVARGPPDHRPAARLGHRRLAGPRVDHPHHRPPAPHPTHPGRRPRRQQGHPRRRPGTRHRAARPHGVAEDVARRPDRGPRRAAPHPGDHRTSPRRGGPPRDPRRRRRVDPRRRLNPAGRLPVGRCAAAGHATR